MTLSNAEINSSLDSLARELAASLKNAGVRSEIHDAVAKKFDGDTNALWSSLAESSTFAQSMGGSRTAGESAATAAAKLPRLQVAVPEHFDSWDPATYTPLVAFFPEGVDDTTIASLTAYRPSGASVTIDAQVAPKRPVIVLSLNERTDAQGRVIRSDPAPSDAPGPQQASGSGLDSDLEVESESGAAATRYSVNMVAVHLLDDKEPWSKGSAEISMRAVSANCSDLRYSAYDWANLNHNDDWWAPGTKRNLGHSGCDVFFYWWEDDANAKYSVNLSYKGVGMGVKLGDTDDRIGGKQVKHSLFEGGSMDRSEIGDALVMWTS